MIIYVPQVLNFRIIYEFTNNQHFTSISHVSNFNIQLFKYGDHAIRILQENCRVFYIVKVKFQEKKTKMPTRTELWGWANIHVTINQTH